MIAFWRYDSFPYLLSGTTDGVADADGFVIVPSYGPRARFKPLYLFSDEVGQQKQEELRAIVYKRSCKLEKMNIKTKNKIDELFSS